MSQSASKDLIKNLGVDAESLSRRRQFIRLGEDERKVMQELTPWIRDNADSIAKEFYDWQFGFGPTESFFQQMMEKKQLSREQLRSHLEGAQAGYLKGVFEGADENWGIDYFRSRLKVGNIHDQINLPLKWYLGSYIEFQSVLKERLKKDFGVKKALDYTLVISKVFNYDIQAICDSFLMATLQSIGLSLDSIPCTNGTDRTENLEVVKQDTNTLLEQAQAIQEGKLNDPSLEKCIKGPLGESFYQMQSSLRSLIGEVVRFSTMLSDTSRDLASGMEQLTSAIREISENGSKTSNLVAGSLEESRQASDVVSSLESHAGEIDDVVLTISSIADQTKVLALNATIEAARAGEAGQGFNVVAREVKELANNTVTATREIDSQVRSIQTGARDSASAIVNIANSFQDISEMTSNLAAAVEEQHVVTDGTMQTARSLEELSVGLKQLVDKFEV